MDVPLTYIRSTLFGRPLHGTSYQTFSEADPDDIAVCAFNDKRGRKAGVPGKCADLSCSLEGAYCAPISFRLMYLKVSWIVSLERLTTNQRFSYHEKPAFVSTCDMFPIDGEADDINRDCVTPKAAIVHEA